METSCKYESEICDSPVWKDISQQSKGLHMFAAPKSYFIIEISTDNLHTFVHIFAKPGQPLSTALKKNRRMQKSREMRQNGLKTITKEVLTSSPKEKAKNFLAAVGLENRLFQEVSFNTPFFHRFEFLQKLAAPVDFLELPFSENGVKLTQHLQPKDLVFSVGDEERIPDFEVENLTRLETLIVEGSSNVENIEKLYHLRWCKLRKNAASVTLANVENLIEKLKKAESPLEHMRINSSGDVNALLASRIFKTADGLDAIVAATEMSLVYQRAGFYDNFDNKERMRVGYPLYEALEKFHKEYSSMTV